MYIRQTCLIPFEQIMEFQQKTKLEMILLQIDISKLVYSFKKPSDTKGPKGYDPTSLIYALIAMQVEKIQTIKDLVLNLKQNPVFRYCCGFDVLGCVP
jgi:transposase